MSLVLSFDRSIVRSLFMSGGVSFVLYLCMYAVRSYVVYFIRSLCLSFFRPLFLSSLLYVVR